MATDTEVIQQIIRHLQTIPIFHHLTDAELTGIYSLCAFRRLAVDETLYKFGAPSDDLFILLDGVLVARSPSGHDLAQIPAVGVVGELGVLTDEPRSADVVCLQEALGFHITKQDLIDLFLSDAAVCRKMLLNLVKILARKLYDTDAEIEKLRKARPQSPDAGDNIFLY